VKRLSPYRTRRVATDTILLRLDVFGAVYFLYATVCHASHLSAFRASPVSYVNRDVRKFLQLINIFFKKKLIVMQPIFLSWHFFLNKNNVFFFFLLYSGNL